MRKHLLLSALALILPLVLPAQQIVKGRIENAPQHKTYMPTFKSDGASKYPKNIILMIGDGTGLAHIASDNICNFVINFGFRIIICHSCVQFILCRITI